MGLHIGAVERPEVRSETLTQPPVGLAKDQVSGPKCQLTAKIDRPRGADANRCKMLIRRAWTDAAQPTPGPAPEGSWRSQEWSLGPAASSSPTFVAPFRTRLLVASPARTAGFVRATAGRLRWAQQAQTQAATRPRGRATRPTRR